MASLRVLLLPGIGTKDDLKMAADYGAKVAQIATHVTESGHCRAAHRRGKKMGMEVIGMLMLSHMASPEKIAEQGKLMESFGADVVLVTDSAGALLPDTVSSGLRRCAQRSRSASAFTVTTISLLRLPTASRRLKKARAGSTPAPAAWAPARATRRPKCSPPCWTRWATRPASTCGRSWTWRRTSSRPIMPKPVRIGKVSLTMGYAGVYSSFLLHADKAAEQFGVDARDILGRARQAQGRRWTRRYDRRSGDDAGGEAETRRESLGHTHFSNRHQPSLRRKLIMTDFRSRNVMTGRFRTHYTECGGNGPALVLCHGGGPGSSGRSRLRAVDADLGSQSFKFTRLIASAASARRTPIIRPAKGVQSRVDQLEAFMDTLCIERAVVGGNSQGAWVAAKYALQHPDRVDKLPAHSEQYHIRSDGIGKPSDRRHEGDPRL